MADANLPKNLQKVLKLNKIAFFLTFSKKSIVYASAINIFHFTNTIRQQHEEEM
jgi:hypothetical protein